MNKLEEMNRCFSERPIPEDFSSIIKRELCVDLSTRYGPFSLKNPIIVAPGQLTTKVTQIAKIKSAGYSGAVLKSVVGEGRNRNCSMVHLRKKPSHMQTIYDSFDEEGRFPIIHWDGRLDERGLVEYVKFAREAKEYEDANFLLPASFVCHLPACGEDFRKGEWVHTIKTFFDAGFKVFEIDFCPFLKNESNLMKKENILRWYETIPSLLKSFSPEIFVYPKLLNLDFGLDFQLRMVSASVKSKADGIIVANRIFKREYNSAHGGKELRERNLTQVREIKKAFPKFSISATGGIYSGKHVFDYLNEGAENVQILSYIMGEVKTPFSKRCGNKFEKVFYELILNPEDGLISHILRSPL